MVDRYETDFDIQCIVASVNDGIGLFGEERVNAFKNRIAKYPLELSEQMITENLWLSNRWNNRNELSAPSSTVLLKS